MIIHTSQSRGHAHHGWLKSSHTFSFADYYNPERMNFGALRVINDDYIAPGMGFGTHPHRDMEIITIPLAGALKHQDSEGNSEVIRYGEVQIMSAGTGIRHSEVNASSTEAVELLQIWVFPEREGLKPRYDQKQYSLENMKNKFLTVVSPDGREGSVKICQNAYFTLTDLDAGKELSYQKQSEGNGVYIFIIKGNVTVDGQKFNQRDGIGIEDFDTVSLKADSEAEILLMEVPL